MNPYDEHCCHPVHPGLLEAYDPVPHDRLDRLTHLVLVDGRLVDTWSEPVEGTRWQTHADRFDRERMPAPEPTPPPWQRALDWLADVCGGPAALALLDTAPLGDDGEAATELPTGLDPSARDRLQATHELLAAVAERWFDDEMAVAFRRALRRLWDEDPDVVLRARTAAHLAGGICWALGRANGCFHPQGGLRMARVKEALDLQPPLSTPGAAVQRSLVGLRSRVSHWWRPDGAPDLLPLGRPELLTSTTRRALVRLRDRAEHARDAEQVA